MHIIPIPEFTGKTIKEAFIVVDQYNQKQMKIIFTDNKEVNIYPEGGGEYLDYPLTIEYTINI